MGRNRPATRPGAGPVCRGKFVWVSVPVHAGAAPQLMGLQFETRVVACPHSAC
jgi:hypothetical protein